MLGPAGFNGGLLPFVRHPPIKKKKVVGVLWTT